MIGRVEDTPLLDDWLVEQFVLRQVDCEVLARLFDGELQPLRLTVFALGLDEPVEGICGAGEVSWVVTMTHQDVSCLVLAAFHTENFLLNVESPMLHALDGPWI